MKKNKKVYVKPAFTHRDKVEVFAVVCDSAWNGKGCRLLGSPQCVKTRV